MDFISQIPIIREPFTGSECWLLWSWAKNSLLLKKTLTFPLQCPTLNQYIFSDIMSNMRGSCAAQQNDRFLVLYVCNPWHNVILEKYYLRYLIAFCYRSSRLYSDICMKYFFKWQCAILAHSQNPQQPVTLAGTYLQISLMVTDTQNTSRFGWNLQSFRSSITGAVSVPTFGVPLDLLLQDLWSHYRV